MQRGVHASFDPIPAPQPVQSTRIEQAQNPAHDNMNKDPLIDHLRGIQDTTREAKRK